MKIKQRFINLTINIRHWLGKRNNKLFLSGCIQTVRTLTLRTTFFTDIEALAVFFQTACLPTDTSNAFCLFKCVERVGILLNNFVNDA